MHYSWNVLVTVADEEARANRDALVACVRMGYSVATEAAPGWLRTAFITLDDYAVMETDEDKAAFVLHNMDLLQLGKEGIGTWGGARYVVEFHGAEFSGKMEFRNPLKHSQAQLELLLFEQARDVALWSGKTELLDMIQLWRQRI